ncbi:hypothetical protein H6G74_18675 [Nostoc spongiaeforme FACHB-130]|uniref:Uncharacterized protein n=1 Tax=Nostoc spongiaeforme FACHB-130 TaxID=1357510 RepID=A0ABR8FZR5_9NOSO|nr:hypothetical protein [Nostoc spongiaeforme]MBD2596338.1 hypothetical protein [Nostoc spongiaeforme FACHB-130]
MGRRKKISFSQFHKKYTLHDSHWIGIFYAVGYEQAVTLAIEWDSVWLPEEIKKRTTNIINNLLYLFIRLTGVEQIDTTNYFDVGYICRTISSSEFEEIESKNFLAIDDVFGGQVNIIYHGEEIFLAVAKDKTILEI